MADESYPKSSPVSVIGNHSFVNIASPGYTTIQTKQSPAWCWGFANLEPKAEEKPRKQIPELGERVLEL